MSILKMKKISIKNEKEKIILSKLLQDLGNSMYNQYKRKRYKPNYISNKDYWTYSIEDDNIYFFCKDENDNITGFMTLYISGKEEKECNICQLYVEPKFRNKGICNYMIAFAEKYCKKIKIKKLSLTSVFNSKAYKIYRKNNFIPYQVNLIKYI